MKPLTRIEHFFGRASGNKRAKKLNPITRKKKELSVLQWEPNLNTITATTTDITAEDNTIYDCSSSGMVSVDLLSYQQNSIFCIVFTSGETPTVLRVPVSLNMPPEFSVESNTRYEINVMNGYATCVGWPAIDNTK